MPVGASEPGSSHRTGAGPRAQDRPAFPHHSPGGGGEGPLPGPAVLLQMPSRVCAHVISPFIQGRWHDDMETLLAMLLNLKGIGPLFFLLL